jgi:hypothetical protein
VPNARPGSITTLIAPAGGFSQGGPTQQQPTEGALEPVEEAALGLRVRPVVGLLLELAQQAPLLLVQPVGHEDVDEDALVAAPEAVQHGHAAAAKGDDLPRLRPGPELELLLAVERGQRHGGAERSLRERHVDGRIDVVALPYEALVRPDPNLDVGVAGPAAGQAGVTFAGQPEPLTVVDARRDLDRERPLLHDPSGAVAFGTGALDPPSRAAARRTRLCAHELAEHAPGHLLQPPGALTGRTSGDRRAGFGAVAATPGAGDRHLERHLARHALCSLDELDLDGGGEVAAAGAGAAAGA